MLLIKLNFKKELIMTKRSIQDVFSIIGLICILSGIFIGCVTLIDKNKKVEVKPIETQFEKINDEMFFRLAENHEFGVFYFKHEISETDVDKIKKLESIDNARKISKYTVHVFRNVFYDWKEIGSMIYNEMNFKELDKPIGK